MKDIYTALITPFLSDYSIDYQGLDCIIKKLLAEGENRFLVCGTTGETALLKKSERLNLVRYITENYKNIHLIVGISSNNTMDVIKQIEEYRLFKNIEAFLIVVPYYLRPNQLGIYKHFDLIASSTDKDIIIYDIEKRVGVHIDYTTVIKLAKRHHNIIGIKYCGDLGYISNIKEELDDFRVLLGNDDQLLEGLNEGADGIVSVVSHIAYPLIKDICLYRRKEDDLRLKKLSELVFKEPSPSPIKYILNKMGYIQYYLRYPYVCIEEHTKEDIDDFLFNSKNSLKDL